MRRVEFTVLILGDVGVDVDLATDELMEFVRCLNPRVVTDISIDIQNLEVKK